MHIYYMHHIRNEDIPFWAMHYLILLINKDGQSMSELTEQLIVDKAHTTRAIKLLEKKGYITCKTDDFDKRIKKMYLTASGEELAIRADKTVNTINSELFKDFTQEEMDTLKKLLYKSYVNVQKFIEQISDNK